MKWVNKPTVTREIEYKIRIALVSLNPTHPSSEANPHNNNNNNNNTNNNKNRAPSLSLRKKYHCVDFIPNERIFYCKKSSNSKYSNFSNLKTSKSLKFILYLITLVHLGCEVGSIDWRRGLFSLQHVGVSGDVH